MKTFGFYNQLETAKEGEDKAIHFLSEELYPTYTKMDLRNNVEYRERDIDFYIEEIGFIEIKVDTYSARNFFIETEVDGKPGWLDKCAADWLFYYFVNEGVAFMIPMPQLRAWCRKNLKDLYLNNPQRQRAVVSKQGDFTWVTYGMLVPITKFDEMPGIARVHIK